MVPRVPHSIQGSRRLEISTLNRRSSVVYLEVDALTSKPFLNARRSHVRDKT